MWHLLSMALKILQVTTEHDLTEVNDEKIALVLVVCISYLSFFWNDIN